MSKRENALRNDKGYLVCYLQEPANGGIDLYDEYNKGIDRIVSAFAGCADKLKKAQEAERDKAAALDQNERDQKRAVDKQISERADIEKQIDDTKARQIQDSRARTVEHEARQRMLDREWESNKSRMEQSALEEKAAAVGVYAAGIAEKSRREQEVIAVYDAAISDLSNVLNQLENDKNDSAGTVRQIKHRISELEGDRKDIPSDAAIQCETEEYRKDTEKYNDAWRVYYQQNCNSGALARELELKKQLAKDILNQHAETERRTNERLEQEGINTVLDEIKTLVRDEQEIEKRSKDYARNQVLGIFAGASKNLQETLKHSAMLVFCYPMELMRYQKNRQFDWIALLPAVYFMAAAYFHSPAAWQCVGGWLAVLLACQVFCRIKGVYGVFRGGRPARLIGSAFYPVYITLLMRNPVFCILLMLLCCLVYFSQDIIFRVKMCKEENQKNYKAYYESQKNEYHTKIQLTDEAVRKQQQYQEEEKANIEALLQRQQDILNQLSIENQKEQEALEKAFQTQGWPGEVEAWKETLLETRIRMREWNAQLDRTIADEKNKLQRAEYMLDQTGTKYDGLNRTWLVRLNDGKYKLLDLQKQWMAQEEHALKTFVHTCLQDRYREADLAASGSGSGIENRLTQVPAYGQMQISVIDWYQTVPEKLQDQVSQAEEELTKLSMRLQDDIAAIRQECEQELMNAAASYDEAAENVEADYRRKKDEEERSAARDKEEIENASRRQIEELDAERESVNSRIRETKIRYQQKAQQLCAQWDRTIADLKAEYRKDMDFRLNQLEENGMADICGFNYKQMWPWFHALATNTLCFPANLNQYGRTRALAQLTAKVVGTDPQYCEFMPKHLIWGCTPVGETELPSSVRSEIADVLGRDKELARLSDWSDADVAHYHVAEAPVDTLYRLSCTRMQDGPAMVVYDLGNLDVDSRKRESFMDFILRTFVFGIFQCVGSCKHLNFRIVSMQHEEYLSSYNDRRILTKEKRLQIYADKSDAKKMIRDLRKSRDDLRLDNDESLFSRNRARAESGRPPAADYEVLAVMNTDYSGLEDTELKSLLEASRRRKMGMYSYLLIDLDWLRRQEDSVRERSLEAIQAFADAIEDDKNFYKLSTSQHGAGYQIQPSRKSAVVAAVKTCDIEEA